MSKEVRHNFSVPTKRLLAAQAAYCCSAPNCCKPTISVDFEGDDSASDGVAAHIVSASPDKGPRADKSYTKEQREAPENGIWLCSNHARIIDSDEKKYSIELLKRWKKDHCQKMAYRASGQWAGSGIIADVSINGIGRFAKEEHVTLGQATLFLGGNAIGKTLLCDIIAGLDQRAYLEQLAPIKENQRGVVKFKAFTNTEREWTVDVSQRVSFKLNGRIVPTILSGFRMVYGRDRFRAPEWDKESESWDAYSKRVIESIAGHFQITVDELTVVLKSLEFEQGFFLDELSIHDGKLEVKFASHTQRFPFIKLSDGEKQICLVEVILRIARYYSDQVPTVLILDEGFFESLDQNNVQRLLDCLKEGALNCQVIVNICYWKGLTTDGWRTWLLEENAETPSYVRIIAAPPVK